MLRFLRATLLCHGKHQFQAVELVDLTRARIAVNRCDVRAVIRLAQVVHDALARNVIRQAAERLQTDDVGNALLDELDHLAREEPPLPRHVAEADVARRKLRRMVDGLRRTEVTALLQSLAHWCAEELDHLDEHTSIETILVRARKQLVLCDRVVGGIQEEVDEVGHHDLCPLPHQHLFDVVVRDGVVLDEDFADDADLWFPQGLVDGDMVKVAHDVLHHAAELEDAAVQQLLLCTRHPFLIRRLRTPLDQLVRHHAVAHVHQEIAVDRRLDGVDHHLTVKGKGIRLLGQTAHGKDGDVREACVAQSLAQDTEVVGRTTCTAGLKEGNARVIGIAQPRLQCGEELSDDDDGRVAHIVVHIAQTEVNGRFVRHRRNDDVIAVLSHRRTEQIKVNRCHLRGENRMRLSTVLGKARTLDDGCIVVDGHLPPRKCGDQRAQTNARRTEVRHLVELDHRVDALM